MRPAGDAPHRRPRVAIVEPAKRLHEKGGKFHQVPVHHVLQGYLDAYISTADIGSQPKSPLFRTVDRSRALTVNRMHRNP